MSILKGMEQEWWNTTSIEIVLVCNNCYKRYTINSMTEAVGWRTCKECRER